MSNVFEIEPENLEKLKRQVILENKIAKIPSHFIIIKNSKFIMNDIYIVIMECYRNISGECGIKVIFFCNKIAEK